MYLTSPIMVKFKRRRPISSRDVVSSLSSPFMSASKPSHYDMLYDMMLVLREHPSRGGADAQMEVRTNDTGVDYDSYRKATQEVN